MALKYDFYTEITENERKWISLINHDLLNVVYCNLVLKPFYLKKEKELESEYEITKSSIMGQILSTLRKIINKIDMFYVDYKNSKQSDIKSLLPLFLSSQMNNISKGETIDNTDRLEIRKQILENEIRSYDKPDDSYLYDDTFEQTKTI